MIQENFYIITPPTKLQWLWDLSTKDTDNLFIEIVVRDFHSSYRHRRRVGGCIIGWRGFLCTCTWSRKTHKRLSGVIFL